MWTLLGASAPVQLPIKFTADESESETKVQDDAAMAEVTWSRREEERGEQDEGRRRDR